MYTARRRPAQVAARRGRQLVVAATAMVNVDFASPSLLLGTGLIGCGVILLNMRSFDNKVSRDADIVVAAMVSIVGSTLIFQGWRLDPLLLLCQALTTSVAFWYGVEAFRLRSKEADMAQALLPPSSMDSMDPQQGGQQPQQFYGSGGGGGQGQPGSPFGTAPPPWGGAQAGRPSLPPGQDQSYPWGSVGQQYGQWGAANNYAETIQYDYYGNPILQQQQPGSPSDAAGGAAGGYGGMPNGAAYGGGGGDAPSTYESGLGAGPGPASGAAGPYAAPPPYALPAAASSSSPGSQWQGYTQPQAAGAAGYPQQPYDYGGRWPEAGGGMGGGPGSPAPSAPGFTAAGSGSSVAAGYGGPPLYDGAAAAAVGHEGARQGQVGRLGLYDGAVDDWE